MCFSEKKGLSWLFVPKTWKVYIPSTKILRIFNNFLWRLFFHFHYPPFSRRSKTSEAEHAIPGIEIELIMMIEQHRFG